MLDHAMTLERARRRATISKMCPTESIKLDTLHQQTKTSNIGVPYRHEVTHGMELKQRTKSPSAPGITGQ